MCQWTLLLGCKVTQLPVWSYLSPFLLLLGHLWSLLLIVMLCLNLGLNPELSPTCLRSEGNTFLLHVLGKPSEINHVSSPLLPIQSPLNSYVLCLSPGSTTGNTFSGEQQLSQQVLLHGKKSKSELSQRLPNRTLHIAVLKTRTLPICAFPIATWQTFPVDCGQMFTKKLFWHIYIHSLLYLYSLENVKINYIMLQDIGINSVSRRFVKPVAHVCITSSWVLLSRI